MDGRKKDAARLLCYYNCPGFRLELCADCPLKEFLNQEKIQEGQKNSQEVK